MKVPSYGFNFKMLKYVKRKSVDEGEDGGNESKLSEPSTSKAGKGIDKKSPLRQFLGQGFYTDWRRKLPASSAHCLWKKLSNMATVLAKLSRHFTTNHSHLSNKKKPITSNDFWIHKTNNVNF
jgi:hypothetical protein